MEDIVLNVYEAKSLLDDMLNVKGFCSKILKKSPAWIPNRYARKEFYTVTPGFSADNIELINNGLRELSEFCKRRILKLPSECNDAEIYAQYATKQLRELREVISLVYLREKYTNMSKRAFGGKLRMDINRNGKPYHFTDADIASINNGIAQMADTFSRLKLTL